MAIFQAMAALTGWRPADPRESRILDYLVDVAQKRVKAKRVILYGSRARGTARMKSDFDLAIQPGNIPPAEWDRFLLDLEENLETLLPIDCTRLDEADAGLRRSIARHGKELYAE